MTITRNFRDAGASEEQAEYAAAAVIHVTPSDDRPALCLEVNGTFSTLHPAALAAQRAPVCPECHDIAVRIETFKLEDLARLAAAVPAGTPVVPISTRLETEVLRVRDVATVETVTLVRLLCDPAATLWAIRADLWQEIRLERPNVYAAMCAGDLTAAYAAT